MAKNAGARVIAISRRPFSLDIARRSGADDVVEMDDHWRIIEEVKELTGGHMCDCVIEAVGMQWPLDLAGELTKTYGRLIIAGYHQDARQVNMQMWNWKCLDVINAHERDNDKYIKGMQAAMDMIVAGSLEPTFLYTHFYKLDTIDNAFQTLLERPEGFIKAFITTT
jgi:threonine dehydrogenase-like Zn-dependent dehydrogenase